MVSANLSPMEKIIDKRKEEKKLSYKIYERIFDLGVNETAELFGITPDEAIKLIIKAARKNNEIEKLTELSTKEKISVICEKIMELRTYNTEKIYEECKDFAQTWEIVIAKCVVKLKLKQEYLQEDE